MTRDPGNSTRLLSLIACAAVTVGLVSGAVGAWNMYRSTDEHFHLKWSELLITGESIDRTVTGHFYSTTPVSAGSSLVRLMTAQLCARWGECPPGHDIPLFAARLVTVLWFALLLFLVFRLGNRLGGRPVGLVASVLVACDPFIIGHAGIVTVDVPFAAAVVLFIERTIAVLDSPTARRFAGWGAAFGLCLCVKFTAVLLLLTVPLLVVAAARSLTSVRAARGEPAGYGRGLLHACGMALLGLIWAAFVICACFRFEGIGIPLGQLPFRSDQLQAIAGLLPGLRLPLPRELLTGIDLCLNDERSREWNVVMFGSYYTSGLWYYFPVTWVFKTPLLLLLTNLIGAAAFLPRVCSTERTPIRLIGSVLAVSALYFCLVFNTQVGLRYVLYCKPLAAVLGAFVLCRYIPLRRLPAAVMTVMLAILLEWAPYVRLPFEFASVFIPPLKMQYFLADSNLDWGRPTSETEQFLAGTRVRSPALDPFHIQPGWNVLSVNDVTGVLWRPERHRWVRRSVTPEYLIGGTHLAYRVTEGDFGRFLLSERVLTPSKEPCSGNTVLRLEPAPAGAPPTSMCIKKGSHPICLDAPHGGVISLYDKEGVVEFRPADLRFVYGTELSVRTAPIWYALPPGTHRLTISAGSVADDTTIRVRLRLHDESPLLPASGMTVYSSPGEGSVAGGEVMPCP